MLDGWIDVGWIDVAWIDVGWMDVGWSHVGWSLALPSNTHLTLMSNKKKQKVF